MRRPDFSQRAFDVLDVWEVHDGDTFALLLDGGFRGYPAPWLRLKDYSCPELNTAKGRAAQVLTSSMLQNNLGTAWVVVTKIPPTLQARLAKRYGDSPRSFARYIADVWLKDDVRLGDVLHAEGYAQPGAFRGLDS